MGNQPGAVYLPHIYWGIIFIYTFHWHYVTYGSFVLIQLRLSDIMSMEHVPLIVIVASPCGDTHTRHTV